MQRVGPTSSTLFVARADGTGERPLLAAPVFDYHAAWAPDGRSLVFTSERRGRGQADLFAVQAGGSSLRPLAASSAVEDAAAVSPDGRQVAFVSTRGDGRANIWTLDLASGRTTRLTGTGETAGIPGTLNGFFRPAWSPDGKWLVSTAEQKKASGAE